MPDQLQGSNCQRPLAALFYHIAAVKTRTVPAEFAGTEAYLKKQKMEHIGKLRRYAPFYDMEAPCGQAKHRTSGYPIAHRSAIGIC